MIEDVEKLIEDYYQRIQIQPCMCQALAGMLAHEFDQLMSTEANELGALTSNRDKLEASRPASCRITTPTPFH